MIWWVCFEISSIPGEERNIRGCYCCWSVTCETKCKRWLNLFATCKIWSPASKEAEEIATKKTYCFATKFKTFCNQVTNPNQSLQSTKNQSLQGTKNRACLQSIRIRACRVRKSCWLAVLNLAPTWIPKSERGWKMENMGEGGRGMHIAVSHLMNLIFASRVNGCGGDSLGLACFWFARREREKTKTPASRHKRSLVAWSLPARCWACAARLRLARPQCCSRGLSQQHVVVFVLLFFSSCSNFQ